MHCSLVANCHQSHWWPRALRTQVAPGSAQAQTSCTTLLLVKQKEKSIGCPSSYSLVPMCKHLQTLLHCPVFFSRTYRFSNLASDARTWSFTGAKEIFMLTPHMVSRWYLLCPAAEPGLQAAAAHGCEVTMQGAALLCSCVWAPQSSAGLQWKPLAPHTSRFELQKASLSLTFQHIGKDADSPSFCLYMWAVLNPAKQMLNNATGY